MWVDGAINTTRLATNFVSLDGLPRIGVIVTAQHWLRNGVAALLSRAPSVASARAARTPFVMDRMMLAHEVHAYWGLAGLLLIWPAVIVALWRRNRVARALALATIVYLVVQGFAGPYDAWRGRYFLSSAVLAVPLAGPFISSPRAAATAVLALALSGVWVSGLTTALIRSRSPLIAFRWAGEARTSILENDRASQLTRNRPELADAARAYEAHVPGTAIVASMLGPDSFEYILFGPRLQRRVVPVGDQDPDWARQQGATFLVFSQLRLTPAATDVHLGEEWWLRALSSP